MAISYFNSAAGGANNGTTKTDAYTDAVTGLAGFTEASGDEIWNAHTAIFTPSAALVSTLQGSGANRGIRFRSMNFSTDVPTFGATFVMAANAFQIYGLIEGIHLDNSGGANNLTVIAGNGSEFAFGKMSKQAAQKFVMAGTVGSKGVVRDSELALGTSYTNCFTTNSSQAEWEILRCTFTGTKGTGPAILQQETSGQFMKMRIVGSDVSGFDSLVDHVTGNSTASLELILVDCILPSSFEVEKGNGSALLRKGARVTLIRCKSGTATGPVTEFADYTHQGYVIYQKSKYRVGGSHDGTSAYALELTALANRTWTRSRHGVIGVIDAGWVDAGSPVTVTAYVAHNAVGAGTAGALTTDEIGMRVYGPSNAGTATAAPYTSSTMTAFGGTATDLTTDSSSTWSGSGVGTKQKMSATFTPTIAGPVHAEIVYCPGAASDKVIYVDAVATLA